MEREGIKYESKMCNTNISLTLTLIYNPNN